jgi:hypothetical protein
MHTRAYLKNNFLFFVPLRVEPDKSALPQPHPVFPSSNPILRSRKIQRTDFPICTTNGITITERYSCFHAPLLQDDGHLIGCHYESSKKRGIAELCAGRAGDIFVTLVLCAQTPR